MNPKQSDRLSILCAIVGVALWLVAVGVIVGWLFQWGVAR